MEVDLPRDALCERAEWHMRCGPDAICDVPTCSVASYCNRLIVKEKLKYL